jgi:hypothetical protein
VISGDNFFKLKFIPNRNPILGNEWNLRLYLSSLIYREGINSNNTVPNFLIKRKSPDVVIGGNEPQPLNPLTAHKRLQGLQQFATNTYTGTKGIERHNLGLGPLYVERQQPNDLAAIYRYKSRKERHINDSSATHHLHSAPMMDEQRFNRIAVTLVNRSYDITVPAPSPQELIVSVGLAQMQGSDDWI